MQQASTSTCRFTALRAPARLSVLLVAVASTSCAINPYVMPVRPPPLSSSNDSFDPQMQRALGLVDQQFDLYEGKVREEYDRQRQVAGSLLFIGAAVLGAAVGSAHRDVILGGALSGALVYQLGSWNTSRARPEIYVEGMKAMACAKGVVAPLRVSDSYLKKVEKQAAETSQARDLASRSFGEVKRWLTFVVAQQPIGQKSAIVVDAEAALAAFPAVRSQVSETAGRATALRQNVGAAGLRLEARVDDIKQLITRALNGTISDLSTLKGAIADLNGLTSVFAPGLKTDTAVRARIDAINARVAPPVEVNTESGPIDEDLPASRRSVNPVAELSRALGKLAGNTSLMASRADELAHLMEEPGKVQPLQLKKDLDGCGIDVTKGGFRIENGTLLFQAGVQRTSYVPLSGGTTPYRFALLDAPLPKGFDVSMPPGEGSVAVIAGSQVETGASFRIRVYDSTGTGGIVTVTVDGPPPSGGGGTERGALREPVVYPAPLPCQGQQGRSSLQICMVQHAVGTAVDGAFGVDSCSRFRTHALTQRFNGLLNDSALAAITTSMGLPDKPSDAQIAAALAQRGVQKCKAVALTAAAVNPRPTAPTTAAVNPQNAAPVIVTVNPQPVAPAAAASPALTASAVACKPKAANQVCAVDGAQCDFECKLSKDQFKTMVTALELNPAPVRFDEATREALVRYQKKKALKVQSGQLTTETAAQLIP